MAASSTSGARQPGWSWQLNTRGARAPQDRRETTRELQSRIVRLYRTIGQSTLRHTAEQRAQMQFVMADFEQAQRRAP